MENQEKKLDKLAKAVIKVMKEVKGMEKNSKVGTGNNSYNGTKDQDVKEVFNDALSKNGLCILPIGIKESTDINRWEAEETWNGKTIIKQKQSVFTKVTTKYLLLHESGQSQIITGYGHGVDTQDKGAGKSTTYALKNTLLYTFLTPVGKIDDTDTTHSDNIPVPPKKNPQPNKKKMSKALYEQALKSENLESLEKAHETYNLTTEQLGNITLRIEELKEKKPKV